MSKSYIWDFWAGKYDKLWVQKYSLTPTRDRILKEMRKRVNRTNSFRMLDMGCGIGQLICDMKKAFLDSNIEYTGVDISPKMIEIAKINDSNTYYFNASVDDFAIGDNKYDMIVCSHSFPYYPDQNRALLKLASMLNMDGTLFLAQASANTFYDKIAMSFVKLTTGKAKYPSIEKMLLMTRALFISNDVIKIKERSYMPTICLFVLIKRGVV